MLAIVLVSAAARAQGVVPPHPTAQPVAEWPQGRADAHDVVVPVVVTVREDGSVADVQVEAGINPAFDEAAVAAVRRWTFEPARRDGVPVTARVRAIVRFPGAPGLKPQALPASSEAKPDRAPISTASSAAPSASPSTPPAAAALKSRPVTVQVTGDRPPRAASEAIVQRDVIEAAPHRTASDLLQVVPGVFITQHSGQGKAHQVFLRGFDAVHGQDIEIWVGGAPVNEVSNVHGQGYADMHFIMPEVVRRIRSIPGAYDPRQGDFAVAGSIHFDLGYDEPGATASATLGSFGEQRYFLAYHPASAPDATFAAFEVQSTDGFGPARAARRVSSIAQATFAMGDAAEARVMASAYSARFDSAGVVRLSDVESGAIDRFASYDPKQGGDSSRAQIVLDLSSTAGDEAASSFSIAPYFIARSLRLRSNFTGFLVDSIEGDSTQQLNEALTVGATGHYRRTLRLLSEDDSLEAGFSVRNDWIEQSQRHLSLVNDKALGEADVDADVRATDVAGYLDASLRPFRRVALRGGLRIDGLSYSVVDHAKSTSGAVRTALGAHYGAKATIDVATLPGLHALASYGDGFRSPQARSLGDAERAPFTRVRAFEGGLRYAGGEELRSTASVFHTDLSDDLVFDQASARNEPVVATQRTGFALDLTMHPRPWITASASFTYTRARFSESIKEGTLVPYAPQIVARSDMAFTPVIASVFGRDLKLHAGTGLTFLAARPLPDAQIGHDVFLADATLGLRLKEIEIKADAFNVLGASWYDGEFIYASSFKHGAAAGRITQRHVTAGAPRTLFVSVSLFI